MWIKICHFYMNSIYVMYQQIVYFKQLQCNEEQQQQTKKKANASSYVTYKYM